MSATEKKDTLKRNEEKWTPTLMKAGWVVIPIVILERQQALGLEPLDVNILLQLAGYWWFKDNPPHPSKQAIAERIGVSKSTVQRRIASMEAGGLIERVARKNSSNGQMTNEYRFDGLIKAAAPLAIEAVEDREKRKKEEDERRNRKRPRVTKAEEK